MYSENVDRTIDTEIVTERKGKPGSSTAFLVDMLKANQPSFSKRVKDMRPAPTLKVVEPENDQMARGYLSNHLTNIPKHWQQPHLTLVSHPTQNKSIQDPAKSRDVSPFENPLNNPWIMPTVPMVGLGAMMRLFGNKPAKKRIDEQSHSQHRAHKY